MKLAQPGMSLQVQDGSMKQVCLSLEREEGLARLWGATYFSLSTSTNFPSQFSHRSLDVLQPSSYTKAQTQPCYNFELVTDGPYKIGSSMGQMNGILTPPASPPFELTQSYDIQFQEASNPLQSSQSIEADCTSASLSLEVSSSYAHFLQLDSTHINTQNFPYPPAADGNFDYKPTDLLDSYSEDLQGTPSSLPALDSSSSSSLLDDYSAFSNEAYQDFLPRFAKSSNDTWNQAEDEVVDDHWRRSGYDVSSEVNNEQILVRFGQGMDWDMESL